MNGPKKWKGEIEQQQNARRKRSGTRTVEASKAVGRSGYPISRGEKLCGGHNLPPVGIGLTDRGVISPPALSSSYGPGQDQEGKKNRDTQLKEQSVIGNYWSKWEVTLSLLKRDSFPKD